MKKKKKNSTETQHRSRLLGTFTKRERYRESNITAKKKEKKKVPSTPKRVAVS